MKNVTLFARIMAAVVVIFLMSAFSEKVTMGTYVLAVITAAVIIINWKKAFRAFKVVLHRDSKKEPQDCPMNLEV